jgi:hypothetical protein
MDDDGLRLLAERCEAASGPDRELDALIRCAVFAPSGSIVEQSPINGAWCIYNGVSFRDPTRKLLWEALSLSHLQRRGEFTASLDAAMALLPEGAGFNLDRYWIREGVRWKAEIATGGVPENPRQVFDCWDAHTAPLAVCAAALRARSVQS